MVELGTHKLDIGKVAAHQHDMFQSPLEEWCFGHNEIADKTAVRANFSRPPAFWALFDRHARTCEAARDITQCVHEVQMLVSKECVAANLSAAEPVHEDVLRPPGQWSGLKPLAIPKAGIRWYGEAMVRLILSWFWDVLSSPSDSVVWVAHCHLLLDFQLASGHPGPYHDSKWRDGAQIPHYTLCNAPFRTRVRWFARLLKECLKHLGQPFEFSYGLPESRVLDFHTGTLALPWPRWRLDKVDQWMLTHLPNGVRRSGQSLDILPLAKHDDSFPVVIISTVEA